MESTTKLLNSLRDESTNLKSLTIIENYLSQVFDSVSYLGLVSIFENGRFVADTDHRSLPLRSSASQNNEAKEP